MITNKQPTYTLAEAKDKSRFPIVYPKDAKTYAKFIQHGYLAQAVIDTMREHAWFVDPPVLYISDTKTISKALVYVQTHDIVKREGYKLFIAYTYGYDRRKRLIFYCGYENTKEDYYVVLHKEKAKKVCFGLDVHKEADRLLVICKNKLSTYYTTEMNLEHLVLDDWYNTIQVLYFGGFISRLLAVSLVKEGRRVGDYPAKDIVKQVCRYNKKYDILCGLNSGAKLKDLFAVK